MTTCSLAHHISKVVEDLEKENDVLKRQLCVERSKSVRLEQTVKLFRQEIQILKDAMLRLEGYVE